MGVYTELFLICPPATNSIIKIHNPEPIKEQEERSLIVVEYETQEDITILVFWRAKLHAP